MAAELNESAVLRAIKSGRKSGDEWQVIFNIISDANGRLSWRRERTLAKARKERVHLVGTGQRP